jgi:hypothetical protein
MNIKDITSLVETMKEKKQDCMEMDMQNSQLFIRLDEKFIVEIKVSSVKLYKASAFKQCTTEGCNTAIENEKNTPDAEPEYCSKCKKVEEYQEGSFFKTINE